MKSLDHPLLSELFYFTEDENCFYLVMEYLENGSLLDLINSNNPTSFLFGNQSSDSNQSKSPSNCLNQPESLFTKISNNNFLDEDTVRKFFVQLIVALDFLHHDQHIAHRDIKLENVILDRYNNIRIIDFGLSAILTDESESLKTTVGSIAYSAPEILMKKKYSKSADIWSAGVILYTLATSKLPFLDLTDEISYTNVDNAKYGVLNDPSKICNMILHGHLEIPTNLSENLQDLIPKMLERDPHKRITIQNIIEHPWFSKEQYTMLLDFVENQDKIENIDLQLDEQIEARLVDSGIDVEMLPHLLFVQEIDEATASYKELRKNKIKEELKQLYSNISLSNNQHEQVQQPNQFNSLDQFVNLGCQTNDTANVNSSPTKKYPLNINLAVRNSDPDIHSLFGNESELLRNDSHSAFTERQPMCGSLRDKMQQPGSLLLQLRQQNTVKQSYMPLRGTSSLYCSNDMFDKSLPKPMVRPKIPVKKAYP